MATVTVTGLTSARMIEIEQASVVSGLIRSNNLILVTKGGSEITAGNVRGEPGVKGDPGGVWDATNILTGGVRLAGNLGGTAEVPTVTGALSSAVELSSAKIKSSWNDPATNEETEIELSVKDLLALVVSIFPMIDHNVLAKGKAKSLWVGTQAEFNALPSAERTDPGFVGVITG
jgi:hypothetical protein